MFEQWTEKIEGFLDGATNFMWKLFERDMEMAEAVIRFFDRTKR
jgi:hypothetical protein